MIHIGWEESMTCLKLFQKGEQKHLFSEGTEAYKVTGLQNDYTILNYHSKDYSI